MFNPSQIGQDSLALRESPVLWWCFSPCSCAPSHHGVISLSSASSQSIDCFWAAAALSALKTFHLVDYLHRNISWFSLCVCMSVVTLHPLLEPPYGISPWLVVLRCFWNLSGPGEMAVLLSPFNNEPLTRFLLCYFYFSLTSCSLSEVSLFMHFFCLWICYS